MFSFFAVSTEVYFAGEIRGEAFCAENFSNQSINYIKTFKFERR